MRQGGPFEEIALRQGDCETSCNSTLLHDSILILPDLASSDECAHLIAAADRWCDLDNSSSEADTTLWRIECHPDGINLDGRSHALAHVLISRALWNLECLRPDLAAELFPDSCDLGDFWFTFSGREPMLNRYTSGGMFEAHQDGHDLTVLVPLSTADVDFEGGGTAFWSEAIIGPDSKAASSFSPSLVLRPPVGTGLFWRGHMTHAGLPVASGMRHVFVASFNLKVAGSK